MKGGHHEAGYKGALLGNKAYMMFESIIPIFRSVRLFCSCTGQPSELLDYIIEESYMNWLFV